MTGQTSNEHHAWHYRPWLACYFQEHGDRQAALDLWLREFEARPSLQTHQTLRELAAKLEGKEAQRSVLQTLLDRWRREFEARPSLQTYQTLQELATELGTWQKLRPAMLDTLDPSRHAALLVDIALEEGDVDRALEIARRPGSFIDRERWARLAQAAGTDRPRDALDIYRQLVERAIAGRGRENYRIAVGHLRRVRDLYQKLGETAEWEAYITRLRQEHRRLPALQDELNKAGL